MTVRDWLAQARRELAQADVPTPDVDAEWLFSHAAGILRSHIPLELDRELTPREGAVLGHLLPRRTRREPLAYVLGEWDFRRLTLRTDRRALVPRPETEVVVERCLALLAGLKAPRVLDIGTGSGAIALAIADEHPGAEVTGVDISTHALALARENARRTGVAVTLRRAGVDAAAEGWDLIVSNPPYVEEDELSAAHPEVRDWEPRLAVVGADVHARIARSARTELLVFEVGDGQAGEVAALLREEGYRDVTVTRDLTGSDRVVEGRGGR